MAKLHVRQYQWIEVVTYQMSKNTRREQSSPNKSLVEQSSYTHNNEKNTPSYLHCVAFENEKCSDFVPLV